VPPLVRYTERGPHPVGVTSLELPDPVNSGRSLPADVWYPADPESYEVCRPADHPIGAHHEARADAPAATALAACPLVAFSHGNSGFSRQSTFLTSHLASWGMVVTAPDHAGNTFFEMATVKDEDERIRRHKDSRSNRPNDLKATIDAVLDPPPARKGAWPQVAPERIGALGHSFGGWTALKMPRRDDRIRAVCGLAPASEPFVGKRAFEEGELPFEPSLPTLLVAALEDVLVDVETSVRPLFDRLAGPTAWVGIEQADHFHFCDHLDVIHGLHEKGAPRPKQTRPTRPLTELLDEARTHRLVRALVTGFFAASLAEEARMPDLSEDDLTAVDPMLSRLDGPTRETSR
jgi:predicted dienelactone hydrolase